MKLVLLAEMWFLCYFSNALATDFKTLVKIYNAPYKCECTLQCHEVVLLQNIPELVFGKYVMTQNLSILK